MANDWFYKNANGTESGPLSAADLKQLAQTGQIDQETLIKKGGGKWIRATQIKGLGNFDGPRNTSTTSGTPFPDQADQYPQKKLRNSSEPPPIPGSDQANKQKTKINESDNKAKINEPKSNPVKEILNSDATGLAKWIGFTVTLLILGYNIYAIGSNWLNSKRNSAINEYNKGVKKSELGQHSQAIADYTKAIEIDNEFADAYNNRSAAYNDLGQFDKALADSSKAIQIDPRLAMAYSNRSGAYIGINQFEKALEDSSKAIQIDPRLAIAYYNRSIADIQLFQFEKAIEDSSKAIQIDPRLAIAYSNRSLAYGKLNQIEKAIEDSTKAIEINPKLWNPYFIRSVCYAEQNKFENAFDDIQKSIDLNPKNPELYKTRGNMYKTTGNSKKAESDFSKAESLKPNK